MKLEKKILEIPETIFVFRNRLITTKERLAEVERDNEIIFGNVKSLVAQEVDDNGRKVYSNESLRDTETLNRLKDHTQYRANQEVVERVKSLEQGYRAELEYWNKVFDALLKLVGSGVLEVDVSLREVSVETGEIGDTIPQIRKQQIVRDINDYLRRDLV